MRAASRSLFFAFLPAVLVVSLAALLTLYFSDRLGEDRRVVLHTFEVIDTARALLSDTQDAETGQRGFIITGRASYLEPYRGAVAAIPERLAALRRLTADDAQQTKRVGELDLLLGTKLDELAHTIALSERDDWAAARAEILSDRGKVAMDGIRRTIGEIIAAESALLTEQVRRTDEAQSNTLYAAMAGLGLGLSGLLVGGLILLQRNRRLRQTERQLSEQGALLQATLDNCRDGIAAFDETGALVAFNRFFFEQLDFPPELAERGRHLSSFQEIERTRPCQALSELARAGKADGDGYQQLRIGARDLEVYRNPMPAGGFVVSSLDITRRLQAEAIVRQAQKMEAIGRLTGGIAHDFNNLVQVIGSNLELLARELPAEGAAMRWLRYAVAGADRGARLTAQLLAFARRQPLDPRVLNLGRVVRDLTDLLQRTLGEQIEVEAIVAGGLWNAAVDRSQVESAILNLAINARDAMPDGGKLTLEVANASLDDAYAARHAEVTAGQYVMLAVSDTGTGMSPETATRVFEPFYTTKTEGRGTGLGLSQIYGFVKQSGGHIKIYSELGHGTTVKVYLPRSRSADEPASEGRVADVVGGTETVLVVEDDAPVRHAVVELLTDLGYRVLKADNAASALAILDGGAAVDLLFTDVVMPGKIAVRELANRAKERLPDIAVLYTSGYTKNAIIHDGRLDQSVLLLSKPYRRDDLARRVRLALDTARSRRSSEPAASPPATDPAPACHRILIVEDDGLVRLATVEMARELGHTVMEAATGQAALQLLESRPDLDVLITDLGLPGMSGQELVAAARKLRPDLLILVATGYRPTDWATDPAMDDEVILLLKPFLAGDLRDALTRLAGRAPR